MSQTTTPTGTIESGALNAIGLTASLTVKDLQKSLTWYTDVLGFVLDRQYERDGKPAGVALRAGSIRILLNQDDGALGWDRVKGQGFALSITTHQSVDDIANHIRKAGGTLATEPADMPWGARVFRLVDPDGFKLSVSTVEKAG